LTEVRAQLPGFLADLRRTLLQELRPPPAAQTAASTSSSTSGSSDESETRGPAGPEAPEGQVDAAAGLHVFVSSSWTARRHRITVGPPAEVDPAAWQTACGWKFGCSGGSREPRPADTDCLRCFPGGF